MKNYKLNLIKGLWDDSHEKQKPQRFARYAAMLIILLTLGVGQMWGGAGYWGDDAVYLKYWLGGDDINYYHKHSATSTKNLGTVTSFYLKHWEFRTWKDGSGNICDYGRMYYRIYLTSASAPSYSYWSQDATSWDGNNQYHYDDCNNNILSGLGGGQYYFQYYFVTQGNTSSSSGCGTDITSNTFKIQFTIDPVVTFKANGGTGSDYTQTVTYNTSTALTANTFTKTGYDFAGWATSADGSVAYANQANITRTSNITLYAKWTAHNYTTSNNIKHADGTTAGQYNVTYDNTSISYTTTPSKTGYNIEGLYKQAAFTNKIVNSNRSLVASTSYTTSGSKWNQTSAPNLYVKWEAKTYNITLHDNNGGSNNGSATATYDGGLSSLSAPTRSGYHVVGYYKEAELTNLIADDEGNLEASTSYTDGSGNWTYDGDRTLYAKWESDATYYTLTYGAGSSPYNNGSVSAANASTSVAISSGASLLSGTEVTFTATPTNSHYKLKGWYSDAACASAIAGAGTTNPYTRAINATQSVYAGFEIKTCTITLDRNGGTSGSTAVTATHGSTLPSFTAHGRTGYTLNGYYTETSGGTKIINADGSFVASTTYANSSKQWNNDATSLTLHAQWTEKKSTVTVNANQTSWGSLTFASTSKSWGTTASVGVATTQNITATPSSGYVFHEWILSGGAASSSTLTNQTITLKGSGTGAVGTATADFGVASGWHMEGQDFGGWGGDNCSSLPTTTQFTYPYRGMANIYYVPLTLTKDHYFKVHHGNGCGNVFNFGSTTANVTVAKGTIYGLTASAEYSGTVSSTLSNVWAVVNTSSNKFWVQDPQTFHNVNVTGADNDKGPVKVTLKTTSAFTKGSNVFETTQFANGETFTVTVTPVSGYIPTITIGDNTPVTWWKEGTYSADGTMSTSDITVTISYTPTRAVRFAKTTGCETLTAAGPSSTSVSDNTKIKDGTVITFHQENSDGYTFSKWYSNNTGTSGTEYSTDEADYALTVSSTRYTIYPIYTENMTTVNLVASPTGKGTFTSGEAVSSVSAGVATKPTVTAVPGTGYHLAGTIWSESSDYISLSATNTAATTITATGETGKTADLTATFTPNTYRVQFHRNGASEATVYQDFTYDVAQNLTANTYTRTGYNFAGWATAADGSVVYADEANVSNLTATNNGTYHLYAKWTAKTTTITYNQSGTGYSSGGQSTTKTATYDAAMPTPITTPTAANGYAFMGYYDDEDGEGTQYYNADGTSARTWNKEDAAVDLYAYFKKAEVTGITFSPAAIVATNATVTATPTISPTPTGTTAVCWELQYSNGTRVPSQPTFTPGGGNAVSFTAPSTSATYRLQAVLHLDDCNGDELSVYSETFQVAGEHTVTVRYQDSDGRTIKASTEITGRPLTWTTAGDITPPTITGYTFARWDAGDGVTIKNGDSDPVTTTTTSSIQIKAVYDGTLTAVYTKKRMIYFYNTLNWGSVYVYFYKNDSYWQTVSPYKGSGSKTSSTWTDTPYELGKHGQMQPVSEGSNIYYFDAEAEGVPSSYDDVVFTEHDQHNYEFFWKTNAVRRGDYKTTMPMFVPLADQTADVHNETNYYNSGYWMNYPENSGYTLKIYNAYDATKETAAVQSIAFPYSEDLKMPLKLDVELSDGYNHNYWFMVYRNDGTYMGGLYTFKQGYQDEQVISGGNNKNQITTSAPGNYTFTLTYHDNGSGTNNYYIDVDFPIATGDYRIVYKDNAAWSHGTHGASWCHPSHSIGKATTEAKKDTVSFFISKAVGITPSMKFQKASVTNEGVVTWADVAGGSITIPSSVTTTGVYNFIVSQPAGGASISLEKVEPYTGNFYIRTDCAGNTKWDSFKNVDHQMTYSDYAEDNSGYSHYFVHWVENGNNVKFTIANDYSMCISDTLTQDYGTVVANIDANGFLASGSAHNANIRFMWNQATNKISRAYISGSSNVADRFLVLEGDAKMFDENGNALSISGLNANEINLVDDQNFVYERTIQVKTTARAKLTAKYNNNVQYFKGSSGAFAEGTTIQLLGGEASDTKHTMRIVYDFKTNRLVTAYVPSGTIESDLAINADLMIVREHQNAGQQLLFNGGKLSDVHTVYGVMRFNKWTLNNKETTGGHSIVGDPKSAYERSVFWISFPFDVKLSDVFGFGTYGVDWIIEYYDGTARAAEGYWADSKGFWKYVMPSQRSTYELKAGKGYALVLDLARMKDDNEDFWSNSIEQVELFFPSTGNVGGIEATNVTTTAESHLYDAAAHPGHTDDRTYKDSHWNMIGVPSYANYGTTLTSDGSTTITWSTPVESDLPYLYEWNAVDNTYTAQTGSTYPFKSMHSYMVQYHGSLYWSLASATPVTPIVARRTYAEKPQNVELRLELSQNEKMIDQTFVKLSNDEEVSAAFKFDEDLSKEMNKNKANIYTMIADLSVAGNTMPMSEQTTVVPVGVKIAADGDYTFAIPDGTEGIGVTLVDTESGVRTSLSALDYTVNLSAGTYNERFVLEISPIKQTPTGIENSEVSHQHSDTRKVLIDGILYIVKDGKMFDARGAVVK